MQSEQFLDINLTYGMAVTIRDVKNRILDKTFKIEEIVKGAMSEKEKEQKGPIIIKIDSDSDED